MCLKGIIWDLRPKTNPADLGPLTSSVVMLFIPRKIAMSQHHNPVFHNAMFRLSNDVSSLRGGLRVGVPHSQKWAIIEPNHILQSYLQQILAYIF